MYCAVEAGVDLAMPVLGLGFHEALPDRQTGIVDQDIDAAKILDDGIGHGLDAGKIRHVRLVGFRLAAACRDLGDQCFRFLC